MKYVKKVSPRLGFVSSALNSLGRGREDGVGDVERVTNEQMKTRFLVGGRREFFVVIIVVVSGRYILLLLLLAEQEWKIRV